MTNASKVAKLRESPGRIEADYVPTTFTPILEVAEGWVKLNGFFPCMRLWIAANPAVTCAKHGGKFGNGVDMALLADGLSAEREQVITTDVAYRYCNTRQTLLHHRRHART